MRKPKILYGIPDDLVKFLETSPEGVLNSVNEQLLVYQKRGIRINTASVAHRYRAQCPQGSYRPICAITGVSLTPRGHCAPRFWMIDPDEGWASGNVVIVSAVAMAMLRQTKLEHGDPAKSVRAIIHQLAETIETVGPIHDPAGRLEVSLDDMAELG